MRQIAFSPPVIQEEEIEAVVKVLRSSWITTGPVTKAFEKAIMEYTGAVGTVCVNSATAAMELVLRILGIGPGDEVITSSYTYTASASVIAHVGATPVLVDVMPGCYHMNISDVKKAITERTKAIIPVDIAGIMCDYEEIFRIVEANISQFKPKSNMQEKLGRIAVIADAAHSFGATYKRVKSGNVADFTCFSFHAVKNLTTAEGGAIAWRENSQFDNKKLYNNFNVYSLHGQTKDALSKSQLGTWEYDIVTLGYKYNMTDIVAALGLSQLNRYETILKQRQNIVHMYDAYFKDESKIEVLRHEKEDSCSSFHLYMIRLLAYGDCERNNFIRKMAEKGIATNVHYKPLPMHTAYKNLGFNIKDYPNAYAMYLNEVTLPLHTLLDNEAVEYIATSVKEIMR